MISLACASHVVRTLRIYARIIPGFSSYKQYANQQVVEFLCFTQCCYTLFPGTRVQEIVQGVQWKVPQRTGAVGVRVLPSSPLMVFQSSPAPEDGRCTQARRMPRSAIVVSILARPRGRALHGGRADIERWVQRVSILARPRGRALLRPLCNLCTACHVSIVSILARPRGRALLRSA